MRAQSCILIVDDDDRGRELLDSLLAPEGYLLVFAENGPQALDQAHSVIPDLILLDVMMPGMDGYEVCQKLRADPILAEVPIILLTALDDRQSRLRGLEAGADDFISKPYDRVELRARVRAITRLNRYRRLLTEQVKFEWAIEQAENGYLLVNERGAMKYANSTAKVLLELPKDEEEWRGEYLFLDWARKKYHCEPEAMWRGWPRNQTQGAAYYLVRPETASYKALWLQVNAFQLSSDAEGDTLVSLRDTTEQMTLQQQIWSFNTLVSHKLRTALMGLSALHILKFQIQDRLTQEEHDLMNMVIQSMERLESQVMGVLEYVDAPEIWKVGRNMPLDEFAALAREIAAHRELTVECNLPAHCLKYALRIAPDGLKAILGELFTNSKKFHPLQAPSIQIAVLCPMDTSKITLRIQDDGRTLSPEELLRVWQPYYQVEKRFTGEVSGMGLGLAVVAAMLWGIGGDCRLSNRSDGPGVAVEIDIPYDA